MVIRNRWNACTANSKHAHVAVLGMKTPQTRGGYDALRETGFTIGKTTMSEAAELPKPYILHRHDGDLLWQNFDTSKPTANFTFLYVTDERLKQRLTRL